MINVKFVTSTGNDVFPGYCSKEERRNLKHRMETEDIHLYCGCQGGNTLEYLLSKDLKFYPAHHGYTHAPNCIRNETLGCRKLGYMPSDEEDVVTLYLSFNPKTFNLPGKYTPSAKQSSLPSLDEEKDASLSLKHMICSLTRDSYMERVYQGKSILPFDYFINYLKGRLKKIKLQSMEKPLGMYFLKEDHVSFFFSKFIGVKIQEKETGKSVYLQVPGNMDTVYSNFIPEKIWETAETRFESTYGVLPTEEMKNNAVCVAGFVYRKESRRTGKEYTAIGRIHCFLVSQHGLFCGSVKERECYDLVLSYFIEQGKIYKVIIPPEDFNVVLLVEKQGKTLFTVIKKKEEASEYTNPVLLDEFTGIATIEKYMY